jgi:hypothetical protein
MNTATNETTLFVFYKAMVAEAAGIAIEALDAHLPRLGRAYDMGEPVWMVAEEMKIRTDRLNAPVKPFQFPDAKRIARRWVKVS